MPSNNELWNFFLVGRADRPLRLHIPGKFYDHLVLFCTAENLPLHFTFFTTMRNDQQGIKQYMLAFILYLSIDWNPNHLKYSEIKYKISLQKQKNIIQITLKMHKITKTVSKYAKLCNSEQNLHITHNKSGIQEIVVNNNWRKVKKLIKYSVTLCQSRHSYRSLLEIL